MRNLSRRAQRALRVLRSTQGELSQGHQSAAWFLRDRRGRRTRLNLTVRDVWALKQRGLISNQVGPWANRPGHEAPSRFYATGPGSTPP